MLMIFNSIVYRVVNKVGICRIVKSSFVCVVGNNSVKILYKGLFVSGF